MCCNVEDVGSIAHLTRTEVTCPYPSKKHGNSRRKGWASLPAAAFKVDRFADAYAHETTLRSRCEQVYACHYWDMY